MSKLLKLKKWLTIKDAAKRLSISAGEKVTEADVLRFALDGHLKLSVYFVNHAVARRGEIVPFEDTNWTLIPQLFNTPGVVFLESEPEAPAITAPRQLQKLWQENPKSADLGLTPLMTSLAAGHDQYINLEEDIFHIRGDVWDLPLIGNERLDVEHAYQQKTKGPAVTLQGIDGAFVRDETYIYQLQDSYEDNPYLAGTRASFKWLTQLFHGDEKQRDEAKELLQKHDEDRKEFLEGESRYYPAGGLPDGSVLIVRTSSLRELEEKLLADDAQPEKPAEQAGAETKPSYFLAIAALLELLKAPVERPRPQGMNQEAIKAAILERFPWRGLSDRNLQTIFAAANKAKADAE
ncbi:hypothetical protein NA643_04555 [Pseudomonas stutzeri]|uniref:hypothetical protein n=1 Tax=Stutzerimonas stutzeri TaxID=316 RepID=UPI000C9B4CC0|nr:hypothetical protein [Stutzerimonas stutzeri]MCQ4278347.1 hypothetical protein [Stutzerimonas stutzeri]PNF72583.1 hypothetical protein CXK96_11315 [Stutzerimonas stutzeri]